MLLPLPLPPMLPPLHLLTRLPLLPMPMTLLPFPTPPLPLPPCGLMHLRSCLCAHQLMVWPHRQAIESVMCQLQRYLLCMELLPDHLWDGPSSCAGLSMRLAMSWLLSDGTWVMSQVEPRTVSSVLVETSFWLPSLWPTAMTMTGRECLHITITICFLLSAKLWTRGRESGLGCS